MLGKLRDVGAVRARTVSRDLARCGGVCDQAAAGMELRLRQAFACGAETPRDEVVAAGVHDHEIDPVLGAALHLGQHLVLAEGLVAYVPGNFNFGPNGQQVVAPFELHTMSGEVEQRCVGLA